MKNHTNITVNKEVKVRLENVRDLMSKELGVKISLSEAINLLIKKVYNNG